MKRRLITLRRIIHAGIVNFIRNFSLSVAAIAVMVVTLTIVLFSIITNAAFGNTITQITNKIGVSVYLSNSVSQTQTQNLLHELKSLPNVKTVKYQSQAQVLASYEAQNAGNQNLITGAEEINNPLPATILIQPDNLNYIKNIKSFLTQPNVVKLQSDPPSYSGNQEAAINKITRATDILREIGITTVIVFAIISALIIFNTIQMAIFNRRDEIQIMRLLGATTWYIRGPFVVESMAYGIISGVLSVSIIYFLFVVSSNALGASSLGILDISYANNYFDNHFWILLTMQLVLGIVLGAISSTIATRRYLKFKTK
jgi:cell division transport system permease protein